MAAESSPLCVIGCHFNPAKFSARLRNYETFRKGIADVGVPLYVIEATFGDDPPEIADAFMRVRATNLLWHKERLLQLLLEGLPEQYEYVAWIDMDVLFDDPFWHLKTVRLLEQNAFVQMFDTVRFLGPDGRPTQWDNNQSERPGFAVANWEDVTDGVPGHPGFAWAARRSNLEACGLFDKDIVGGSDRLMAMGFCRKPHHPHLYHYSEGTVASFRRWYEKLPPSGATYLSSPIRHLWHGHRPHRQYEERTKIVLRHHFDPERHLRLGPNKLWEWTEETPTVVVKFMEQHFAERQEDAV